MAQAVSRDDLGAWLLKANPAVWDVRAFVDSGERRLTSWSVQRNYRSALMRPGDRVLFWVSGNGRQGLHRGIWGDGVIVAEAEDWVDAEPGLWLADRARQAVRARVEVDIEVWEVPITVAALREHGVDDLEVLRLPVGANPSWLSVSQLRAVEELMLR